MILLVGNTTCKVCCYRGAALGLVWVAPTRKVFMLVRHHLPTIPYDFETVAAS